MRSAKRIVGDLQINDEAVARNLALYGAFAATERLLMNLVRQGADRQEMHEVIREHAMAAWASVQSTGGKEEHSLAQGLSRDERINRYVLPEHVLSLLDASAYVGDAPTRARAMAREISSVILAGDSKQSDAS